MTDTLLTSLSVWLLLLHSYRCKYCWCFPVCRWSRQAEQWWSSRMESTTRSCTYRQQVCRRVCVPVRVYEMLPSRVHIMSINQAMPIFLVYAHAASLAVLYSTYIAVADCCQLPSFPLPLNFHLLYHCCYTSLDEVSERPSSSVYFGWTEI